jgi:primosomal protein N' (replication factor Y)
VIKLVEQHDFVSFYKNEIIERENYFYPPFYKLITVTLKHKDEPMVEKAAFELAKSLREVFKERVLGPEFPIIKRIQNQFLKEIKLKIERTAPDKKVKERIATILNEFYSKPRNKAIKVAVDVDPL